MKKSKAGFTPINIVVERILESPIKDNVVCHLSQGVVIPLKLPGSALRELYSVLVQVPNLVHLIWRQTFHGVQYTQHVDTRNAPFSNVMAYMVPLK